MQSHLPYANIIWGFLWVRLAQVPGEGAVAAPAGEQAPAQEAARDAEMLLGMPALLEGFSVSMCMKSSGRLLLLLRDFRQS